MTNVTNARKVNGRTITWRRRPSGARLVGVWLAAVAIALSGTSCSLDNLLKNDQLPPDVRDPAVTQTPAGALETYRGTVALFTDTFAGGGIDGFPFAAAVGLFGDELRLGDDFGEALNLDNLTLLDRRSPQDNYDMFGPLQKIRGQGGQAVGLLSRYLPEQPALAGHLYALMGYSELFLAELFCSGIPLSTLDYAGDYTVQPGSTTEQVFQHAAALFDTAKTLAEANLRFIHLAAVGKGRALLGQGDYAAAAAAVAAVPDDYRYEVQYAAVAAADSTINPKNFVTLSSFDLWLYSVADQEGANGLDYITSGDPRTPARLQGTNPYGYPVYTPAVYAGDGSGSFILASGVEARLIEAEAALKAGDGPTWLAKLNALRTDGTFEVDTQVVAVDNTVVPPDTTFAYDTLWHAGSGGVDSLAPLADPGTADGRVDLLFRERAFWLFLTGHRQGDLRRLIRQYGRQQQEVYPIGAYPGVGTYGGDVTLPVPLTEVISNPLYTGCFSRGA